MGNIAFFWFTTLIEERNKEIGTANDVFQTDETLGYLWEKNQVDRSIFKIGLILAPVSRTAGEL